MTLPASEFPLHEALRKGSFAELKELLNSSRVFCPDDPDEAGLSPVHHVAVSMEYGLVDGKRTSSQVLDMLLNYYKTACGSSEVAVLGVKDLYHGNTVTHLACKYERQDLVQKLLEFGDDGVRLAMERNNAGWLPLHFAAESAWLSSELIDLFMSHNLKLKPLLMDEQFHFDVPSPVQVAARKARHSALKTFLKHGFSFKSHEGASLLQCVVESGDSDAAVKCIYFLATNIPRLGTENVFNTAALERTPKLMKTLLKVYSQFLEDCHFYDTDANGNTALHILSCSGEADSIECVELLLDPEHHTSSEWQFKKLRTYLAQKNVKGQSALDICIGEGNLGVAKLILMATYNTNQIPNPEVHFWLEHEVLDSVYAGLPEAMLPVLTKSYDTQHAANKRRRLRQEEGNGNNLDYEVITGVRGSEEEAARCTPSAHLHHIATTGDKGVQKELLLHPLVVGFRAKHWGKYHWLSYTAAAFQLLILLGFGLSISACYNCDTDGNDNIDKNSTSNVTSTTTELLLTGANDDDEAGGCCCWGWSGFAGGLISLLLVLFILTKELLQLCLAGWRYFSDFYNLCQLCFCVSSSVALLLALSSTKTEHTWLLSVVAIQLAWLVAVCQLRNLPACGRYFSIFFLVTERSLKILALLGLPTLIVFSLTFQIIVRQGTFQSVDQMGAGVKVLAMLTGELTFDEIAKEMADNAHNLRYFTVLVVLALFSILATVVLFNLLVAMAVDITNDLKMNAESEVARCQLEQIHFWETLLPNMIIVRDRFAASLRPSIGVRVPSANRLHGNAKANKASEQNVSDEEQPELKQILVAHNENVSHPE